MTSVAVHPLVLLSVVDHYHRVIGLDTRVTIGSNVAKERSKRVIGVLLGNIHHGVINIANSFALPFEEESEGVWFVDSLYLENMFALFKKVAAKERILGWYHTGPKLYPSDLAIHQLFKKYTTSPVLVMVDVAPKGHTIPTDAYKAVEVEGVWTFAHLPSAIEAEEAEEIGVEHLLRDIREHRVISEKKNKENKDNKGEKAILSECFESGVPMSARIEEHLASLKTFEGQLSSISSYLQRVSSGVLPMNQEILSLLQNCLNALPDLDARWQVANTIKSNDEAAMIYSATMLRSVLALHALIDNKLSVAQAEKVQ